MSAVPGAAALSRASGSRTLRWGTGPVLFELLSSHPRVHRRARVVFAPWLADEADLSRNPPIAGFVVEAVAGPGRRWRMERAGSPDTTICDSLDIALTAVEYGAIAELLAPDSGVISLHAALLSRGGRGVLLVGPKESGKSTLACALWRAGWAFHSDDTALIEAGPRARGIPRRVSLRETSRVLLGRALWERILSLCGTTRTSAGILFHPRETTTRVPETVEVAAVMFLARRGAAVTSGELRPLDAGRALLALTPYCNRREPGIGWAIEALQPLADRVGAYDLGRADLAAMVERVEEAAAT